VSGALHPLLGLAALLSVGALVAWGLYAAGVWREAVRPPRRGMAWALAQGLPASPADLGLAFEERTVRGPEATVPGWWIAGRGPAEGPTVVLVHGHGRSRWDSLRRIGPWVERSPLVILVDLRGHGDAEGPSTLGRREHLDLEAVVAEAERRRPGAAVELVGHSLGAVVAIRTAARRTAARAPSPPCTPSGHMNGRARRSRRGFAHAGCRRDRRPTWCSPSPEGGGAPRNRPPMPPPRSARPAWRRGPTPSTTSRRPGTHAPSPHAPRAPRS
jgi:pimeloyl-ACP methyl ester carboxylesterase